MRSWTHALLIVCSLSLPACLFNVDPGQSPGEDTGGEDTGGGGDVSADAGGPDAACVEDVSYAEVCALAEAECGSILYDGACGEVEIDCGAEFGMACEDDEVCTQDNVCECRPAPSLPPAELCANLGAECGEADAVDSCGAPFEVACGGCAFGEYCSEGACEADEIVSAEAADGGRFGGHVSMSSGRLAVGHTRGDTGFVEIYERLDSTWIRTEKLNPKREDGQDAFFFAYNPKFGSSVELRDDEIVVGMPERWFGLKPVVGSVYLFAFENRAWVIKQVIDPPDTELESSLCGTETLLVDDTLYVGCPGGLFGRRNAFAPSRPGRVEVYRRASAQARFEHVTTLTAPDGDDDTRDMFGYALAMSAGGLLVGAPTGLRQDGVDTGVVYLYSPDDDVDGGGVFERAIAPAELESGNAFGFSLDANDSIVAMGAPSFDKDGNDRLDLQGAVFLFSPETGATSRLVAPDSASGDSFGFDVAVGERRLMVGAPYFSSVGAVFVVALEPEMPARFDRLGLANPWAGDDMGFSVDLDDSYAVAAAPGVSVDDASEALENAGSILVFPWSRDP